jgi:ferredoxin
MARYITKDEAVKIIKECEETGLVHLSSNCSAIEAICNCCSCCCGMLGSITRLKDTSSHPVSNYYTTINADDCNACGVCEDRCPTKAINTSATISIDSVLCIGCGLCASACPTDAIQLIRRPGSTEPLSTVRDLGFKLAEEKGRLQALIANKKGQ